MRDVVFVVVDAARPDAVGHLDSPGDPTPTLDGLASRGVSFPRAYSCINTTDPSLTSIHTGCFPATTGLLHHGQQVSRAEAAGIRTTPFLPELLSDRGYDTGAVDWLGRWHDRGFDYYTGSEGLHDYSGEASGETAFLGRVADAVNARREYVPGSVFALLKAGYRRFVNPVGDKSGVEDAETTTDRAIDLVGRTASPRYLFVHYWDVHAPYETPREYAESAVVPEFDVDEDALHEAVAEIENDDRRRYIQEILDDGLDRALRQYYGAMSYVDDQLARLLEHVPDDAYVVVMADHGESLFEHGIFFEHHGLYEVNTRVPLVIDGPDVPSVAPTDGFVQLCDVMPTVLGRLGVDPGPVDGIDAFERMENGESFRDAAFLEEAQTQRKRAIRTDCYRYVRTLGDGVCSYCETRHGDAEMLFDLHADPDETTNVVDGNPDVAAALRERLDEFFAAREPDEREAVRRAVRTMASTDRL